METIEDWIKSDIKLSKALCDIEKASKSTEEQAEMVFHTISDLLGLPKYPEDVNEDIFIKGFVLNTSVYEQLGFLKYLEPSTEMLKDNVITAIYFLSNGTETDLNFIFEKHISEGGTKAEISGFGFKNHCTKVDLILVRKNESWFDLGCKYFTKYI